MDEPRLEYGPSAQSLDICQSFLSFNELLAPGEACLPETELCNNCLHFVKPWEYCPNHIRQSANLDLSKFLDLPSDALSLSETNVDPSFLQGSLSFEGVSSASEAQFGLHIPDQIAVQDTLEQEFSRSGLTELPRIEHATDQTVAPAGSCEMLFDMNMNPREKRQLRKKTQQEKEAYLGLRRKGGACPEHRASKRVCRHDGPARRNMPGSTTSSNYPPEERSSVGKSSESSVSPPLGGVTLLTPGAQASATINPLTDGPAPDANPSPPPQKDSRKARIPDSHIIVIWQPNPEISDCLKGCLSCPYFLLKGCGFFSDQKKLAAHLEETHDMKLLPIRANL